MIFILKNYENKVTFIASSIITLKYLLSVNKDILCLNYQFKKMVKKWIKLHKYIKIMKMPHNIRNRELGLQIVSTNTWR